jgi:hypothetical protein
LQLCKINDTIRPDMFSDVMNQRTGVCEFLTSGLAGTELTHLLLSDVSAVADRGANGK